MPRLWKTKSGLGRSVEKNPDQWPEENLKLNDLLNKDQHHFIHADVNKYLDEIQPGYFRPGQPWDPSHAQ